MKKSIWNKKKQGLALLMAIAMSFVSIGMPVAAAKNPVDVSTTAAQEENTQEGAAVNVNTTSITDLKTDDLANPMGIDNVNPLFSWKMESSVIGQCQTAYQVLVSTDTKLTATVWDSGRQESDKSVGIKYEGSPLEASTVYYWQVKVWDKDGVQISSDMASFEMGLLGNEGWNESQWIQLGTSAQPPASTTGKIHYVVEADIQIVHNSISLLIESTDKKNYLLWQFNNNNPNNENMVFKPHSVKDGVNFQTIREINVNQFVKGSNSDAQHIKVEVTNDSISTYMNGNLIETIPAQDLNGVGLNGTIGRLGFRSHQIDLEDGFMDNVTLTDYSVDSQGILLKNHDFEDGVNPFDVGDVIDGRLSTKYVSGETIGMEKVDQGDQVEKIHYQVEADVTCSMDAVSLVFNAADNASFYMLQLNTKDQPGKVLFKPHTWNNGSIATYNDHTKDVTTAIGSIEEFKSNPAHILIDVTETEIKTYINEQLVDTFQVSESKGISPQIGYLGFRSDLNETGTIDNFKLVDMTENESGEIIYDYNFDNENPFLGGRIEDGKFVAYQTGILLPPQGVSTFRKEITPKSQVVSAKLYTAGLGVYDVFINGERVGTKQPDGTVVYDELKPGYTHLTKRTFYHTYDVTDMITNDQANVIAANVTSGWWSGRVAGGNSNTDAFRAQLLLTYEDGSTQVIGTDRTWKGALKGPIMAGDIYDGETYDANADTSFRQTGYDDAAWKYADVNTQFNGLICPQTGPSIQVREDLEITPESATVYAGAEGANEKQFGKINVTGTYSAEESFTLKAGEIAVFDMGQNFSGWGEIQVEGEKNTMLTMRHGEMLNDNDGLKSRGNDGPEGSIYTANLRTAKATGRYVLDGSGVETYNASSTFYGFRYMELSSTRDVTIHGVKGIVVTSVANDTGKISTSDEDVNKLISNIFWGQYSNYLSTATDSPQRDERKGWTADTQVFSTAAAYNSDSKGFLKKYMDDMNDSQIDAPGEYYDGAYADTAPYNGYGEIGQLGWADAGVIIPYNLYKMYGDKSVIEQSYDNMTKFMDVFMEKTNKFGGGHNHGDWLSYEANLYDDEIRNLFGIAYYAWDAQMMAEMATVLGKTEDAEKYNQVYEEEKAFFQELYVNEDGTLKRTEQSACLMALKFDLLPDEKSKELVKQALIDNIKRNGDKLQTGFLGTAIILQTLSDIGATDVAYQLLLQHDNPSWLYSVDQGATTIWERWNSYTVEKGFGPVNMNSFNHYAYGAVAEWMYGYMAGIMYDTTNPGFKHTILQPSPDQSIQKVDASYNSAYGTIVSNWTLQNGSFEYDAQIPANTTATIYIPVIEGKDITVNGKPQKDVTTETDGLKYIETKDNQAVFEAVSGAYHFNSVITDYYEITLNSDPSMSIMASVDGGTMRPMPPSIRVEKGESVTIKAQPYNNTDYVFAGWTGDKTEKNSQIEITPNKDMSLTVKSRWIGQMNLSKNKKVTSNCGWDVENWSHANLVDGILTSEPESLGFTTTQFQSTNVDYWVEIDLGSEVEFDRIQLYPRSDEMSTRGSVPNFPKDFSFEVREQDEDGNDQYKTIGSYKDYVVSKGKPAVFDVGMMKARYIRLHVTKLGDTALNDRGNNYLQLAEMGVYNTTIVLADKSELKEAVKNAEIYIGEEENYSELIWKNFQDALTNAEELIGEDIYDQTIVNEVTKKLNEAIDELVKEDTLPVVLSVKVSPESVTIKQGKSQQFTAVVTGKNDPVKTVTWEITGNRSKETAITSEGLLSVAKDETASELTVKAISTANTSIYGTEKVLIAIPANKLALEKAIKDAEKYEGKEDNYATANWKKFQDALTNANETVGKEIYDQAIVDGITEKLNEAIDELVKEDTLPVVVSVKVSPESATIEQGKFQQFEAEIIGKNNPAQTVTWEVTGNVSMETTITAGGLLSVAKDETSSEISIKAISTVDTSKFKTVKVDIVKTVDKSAIEKAIKDAEKYQGKENNYSTLNWKKFQDALTRANEIFETDIYDQAIVDNATKDLNDSIASLAKEDLLPIVVSVKVSPETVTVEQGKAQQFIASVTGRNNPAQTVTWSMTGNTSKATNISADGLLSVSKDEKASEIAIIAVSTADKSKSGTAKAIIKSAPITDVKVSSITVKAASSSVFVKDKTTVKATVLPASATNKSISWTSSNPKVASVDTKGNVTAKKNGTVKITATATDGGKATGSCTIKVKKPTVNLNATSTKLQLKKSSTALKATGLQSGDKIKSWSVKNKKVATISQSGKITAKGIGSTTITVKTVKGATDTCKLTVVKGAVTTTKLTANTKKVTLEKGKKYQLKVNRTPITATEKITYSTSNKKIAAISKDGKITAKKKGKATIVIKTSNGKSAKVTVTVK